MFTDSEETKLRAIMDAFDNAQQVDDLPAADLSATDKVIEVMNKTTGASQQMSLKDAVNLGRHAYCGRVWNLDNATPKAAMYVGSLELLRELPERLGLGCYLVKEDHSRRKLDSKDHYKYATGEAAKLDGSEGHYMWGWNKPFYVVIKTVGRLHYELISLSPIAGEYNYKIPVGSMSASGHAALERSTGKLVSYINEGEDYRGGDNKESYDGTNLTLLGRPATYQDVEYFRAAARKNGDGWLATTMRHTSIVAILFDIIYGTHYVRDAVNGEKDANGLYQGGLGHGVVGNGFDLGSCNFYRPIMPMSTGVELGDGCGEASYEVEDNNGVVHTVKVPCFFGLKNIFGYLGYKMDDEQTRVNEDKTFTHLVAPSIYGTWTIGKDAGMVAYSTSSGDRNGYIKTLSMDHLENFCTTTGGSDSTYYTSYFWGGYGPISSGSYYGCVRNGYASYGVEYGLSFLKTDSPERQYYDGAALCEAESEWLVEPTYYEGD